ncbi:MAG TPA: DinB family protein [Chitinophagaceae bacterium]|nr:DinB family protein [Chitinophagaceae bacterium]
MQPEVWQRGPIPGVPALLQPVAHTLLQAEEDINEAVRNLPPQLLWQQPAGVASIAFHLQHIKGVLNRLFTYTKGEMLTGEQLEYLKKEGVQEASISAELLLNELHSQIEKAIHQLKETPENILTEKRGIGRKQIPTTVIGLLFHAAEHTMRHTGQLLVTAKILCAGNALH